MDVKIHPSWKSHLKEEFDKDYFLNLVEFVKSEYSSEVIYPPGPLIFRAFNECSFDDCKVVIIGQDPYHTPKVANGLAFSASDGQRIPPSLLNIYKELKDDLGKEIPKSPDLTNWARQGVLLLNSTLTVRKGMPASHQGKGWEEFTDAVIRIISNDKDNIVFFLWGAYAGNKESLIDSKKHLIIKSAHPSPFSANRGFFGSKPFSKANDFLESKGKNIINW